MANTVEISPSAEEQLEFHKVREILSTYAKGEAGKSLCLHLHPSSDIDFIRERVNEVYEFTSILSLPDKLQLTAYEDLSTALDHLAVEGFVLSQEELHEMGTQLEQAQRLFPFFQNADWKREFPSILTWLSRIVDPANQIRRIRSILDEKGDVRPNASPALLSISSAREAEVARLNREFVKLIGKYKGAGYLADTLESIRNGRRVLCVAAEHKRQIKGIIHDESTTGRTVFIEPELIVEINNTIIELEAEFKKEVYRLLKDLCQELRPYKEEIENITILIQHWDLIQSLALAGISYKGNRPRLQDEGTLYLIQARHPLLYLKNKAKGKNIVSFDLRLQPPNRLLVLSGPNAGGKSILLKATGLIQVMAQCGMLIPADGGTIIGVMTRVVVDIGDQQSIEEDLSTYSSRLMNMKEALSAASESTLILVDEFGSGTDPKIGGAIAEAILDAMVKRRAFGVLTTHYPNIKAYAHNTKGVVNGAMLFDKEKILPTYQLKIGKPGSSFAFEIAERTGLPEEVIAYARKRAGTQAVEMEDLIHDLDDKVRKLDAELANVNDKQRELDRLIANYEQLRLDLEIKRKKFKIDQKKASLNEVSQYSQEMNRLMKDLKKEKDAEKAKKQIEKLKAEQSQAHEEIKSLSAELLDLPGTNMNFKPGDFVKLKSTQQIGTIDRIEKSRAVITIGQLQMTLPLEELLPSKSPVEVNHSRSIQSTTGDYSRFENELDIRGMPPEEATLYLERFIDAAFMSSRDTVRIVHGKGTGTLRQLVSRIMKSYPFKSVRHPEKQEGGDGVTIGEL
jgi:DNA mismatch repair protein MutS2